MWGDRQDCALSLTGHLSTTVSRYPSADPQLSLSRTSVCPSMLKEEQQNRYSERKEVLVWLHSYKHTAFGSS